MKYISSEKAPAAIGPYSQAIVSGGLLFASGQIPLDPSTGEIVGTTVVAQTEQAIANIKAVLSEAGLTLENVVKTTCYLADMADFSAFNTVYAAHFTGKPARSCVAVKALPKGALVEIEVTAEVI
jgi:2-iminobutanoate/2-iminopropanoate deaminase